MNLEREHYKVRTRRRRRRSFSVFLLLPLLRSLFFSSRKPHKKTRPLYPSFFQPITQTQDLDFDADPSTAVDTDHHSWGNYFVCGYKGVFEFLESKGGTPPPTPCSLDVLVHGTVPLGSGLSSSAALVCASALAVLAAHGLEGAATQGEVATFAASCERCAFRLVSFLLLFPLRKSLERSLEEKKKKELKKLKNSLPLSLFLFFSRISFPGTLAPSPEGWTRQRRSW